MTQKKKIIVIGAGAAGLMAACAAADGGAEVTVLEHNEKAGKKIYITGKGRCNYTNACETEEFFSNVLRNPKFLYSAVYGFDSSAVTEFLEKNGCATKEERGKRCFPASDHAFDVTDALVRHLRKNNGRIRFHADVAEIRTEKEAGAETEAAGKGGKELRRTTGVRLRSGEELFADAVIVAAGGMSYPSTGSTGDGYEFAKKAGHRIIDCTPSLVPFNIREEWVKDLQGLSLKNSAVTIYDEKKKLYSDFGEMLFTHFGVSGPMILSASGNIKAAEFAKPLKLVIDLKPAMTEDQLDKRILRDFDENKNKQFRNSVSKLLPSKLIPIIIDLSGIDPDKKVNEISKEERSHFVHLLKNLTMTINGLRGWNEAIITKGGINVKDVNPSTMESKLVSNLFFAGEVLDLDAMTGGYNLQIAWSTGYLAGISCV